MRDRRPKKIRMMDAKIANKLRKDDKQEARLKDAEQGACNVWLIGMVIMASAIWKLRRKTTR